MHSDFHSRENCGKEEKEEDFKMEKFDKHYLKSDDQRIKINSKLY